MLLVKVVVPVPSEVKFPAPKTGLALVLQQTPFAVIGDPPSEVIVPPLVALFAEVTVTALVDATTGAVGAIVVKLRTFP